MFGKRKNRDVEHDVGIDVRLERHHPARLSVFVTSPRKPTNLWD